MTTNASNIQELAAELFGAGLIRTWYRDRPAGWTLVSGIWSPFYIQLRPIVAYPALLKKIGQALAQLITDEIPGASRLVGIAMAGIPLAVAASLESGLAAGYTRKQSAEDHGEHLAVEGEFRDGDRVVLVDDVVTRFDSKRVALDQVAEEARRRAVEISCKDIVVIVDRAQGGQAAAESAGVLVHSLLRLDAEGLELISSALLGPELDVIRAYLQHPDEFQDRGRQEEIAALSKHGRTPSAHPRPDSG